MEFILKIELGSEGMQTTAQVIHAVRSSISRVEANGYSNVFETGDGRTVVDENGNIVGKWEVTEKPEVNPLDQSYRDAAEEKFGSEGQIEIDGDAVISYGDDDGAYVQAWLWVEGNLVPTLCSGEFCKNLVEEDDKYHATPCGTFCNVCMEEHASLCKICADEFDLEYDGDAHNS